MFNAMFSNKTIQINIKFAINQFNMEVLLIICILIKTSPISKTIANEVVLKKSAALPDL